MVSLVEGVGFEIWVQGSGCRVQGLRIGVQDLARIILGVGLKGAGFGMWASGVSVQIQIQKFRNEI